MTNTFEHTVQPGRYGLSIMTFIGLGCFAALLWQVAPGYVVILMVPALAICLWQMISVPTYGIRMNKDEVAILGGYEDLSIPTSEINHLLVREHGNDRRVSFILNDGTEVQLPAEFLPEVRRVAHEASECGIAVRNPIVSAERNTLPFNQLAAA